MGLNVTQLHGWPLTCTWTLGACCPHKATTSSGCNVVAMTTSGLTSSLFADSLQQRALVLFPSVALVDISHRLEHNTTLHNIRRHSGKTFSSNLTRSKSFQKAMIPRNFWKSIYIFCFKQGEEVDLIFNSFCLHLFVGNSLVPSCGHLCQLHPSPTKYIYFYFSEKYFNRIMHLNNTFSKNDNGRWYFTL